MCDYHSFLGLFSYLYVSFDMYSNTAARTACTMPTSFEHLQLRFFPRSLFIYIRLLWHLFKHRSTYNMYYTPTSFERLWWRLFSRSLFISRRFFWRVKSSMLILFYVSFRRFASLLTFTQTPRSTSHMYYAHLFWTAVNMIFLGLFS